MTTFSDFWFSLEVQIGLLAACLPTVPSLFKGSKFTNSFRGWWGSVSGSTSPPRMATGEVLGNGHSLVFITESLSTKK